MLEAGSADSAPLVSSGFNLTPTDMLWASRVYLSTKYLLSALHTAFRLGVAAGQTPLPHSITARWEGRGCAALGASEVDRTLLSWPQH